MVASNSAKHRMDRIIRLHEEIDQIKKDIRDIYAEEKAEGGDKTAMGEAITKIRKREKDKTAFDERENMVDVYLMAYSAPSRTHTHAREDRSDAGLNIITKHTEITASDGSPSVSPLAGSARAEESAVSHSSRPATLAGSGGDRSIPSPDAGGEKMDDRSNDDPGRSDETSAFYDAKSGQATTNSPETATQSTAARKDVHPLTGDADLNHAGAGESPATISEKATVATQGEATAPTSDERVSPGGVDSAAANAGGDDVARSAMRAGLADPAANIGEGAANTALPDKPKYRLRPNCLDRSNCKSGTVDHCWSCKKAMAEKSEEAA